MFIAKQGRCCFLAWWPSRSPTTLRSVTAAAFPFTPEIQPGNTQNLPQRISPTPPRALEHGCLGERLTPRAWPFAPAHIYIARFLAAHTRSLCRSLARSPAVLLTFLPAVPLGTRLGTRAHRRSSPAPLFTTLLPTSPARHVHHRHHDL